MNSFKLWSLCSPSQKTSRSIVHARFHCLAIPRRDRGTKKTKPNLEKLLYSLGVMLQFWGLFTWRWGTSGRWGNPLGWGNPPVHIISHFNLTTFRDRWGNPPRVTSPTWGPPAPCKQALNIISIVDYSEWTKIALRAVTIYRPETYTNIREFLTFVWLLSWKCHVCLSFVIKMRKMTKIRKKLQSSYSDVIRALGYCWPRISCVFTHVASIHANLLEQKKSST